MTRIKAWLPIVMWLPLAAWAVNCGDLTTQFDMNQCAMAEYKKSDQALNQVNGRYRTRLNEVHKRQLAEVQRAWIRFRDLSCEFKSSGIQGGSAHPFVLAGCMSEMTATRTSELQALETCAEGDLACPSWK